MAEASSKIGLSVIFDQESDLPLVCDGHFASTPVIKKHIDMVFYIARN